MNRFDALKRWTWSVFVVSLLAFAFAGCSGDDGATGPQGPQGPAGADGQDGADGVDATTDPIAQAKVESCGTCHGDVGTDHQDVYDRYTDGSTLALTFGTLVSVPDLAGGFTVTLPFNITKNGVPYADGDGLPTMDQVRFEAVQYFSATGEYRNECRLRDIVAVNAANGDYEVSGNCPYAPEALAGPEDGAHVYGYIAQGSLFEHVGGTGAEILAGGHVHLYDDVASAAVAFGTAAKSDPSAYVSAANVSGCEKCHGKPYLKHGFRDPIVEGIPDFASCKSCHYDDRNGGHRDWQYMVDRPLDWATGVALLPGEYDYTANIMNDVHMSHAMEFPYPQSMQNCATCHEGKLGVVLDNANFTAETCLSCHPPEGVGAGPDDPYEQPNRAPALADLWEAAQVDSFHNTGLICTDCHNSGPTARQFNELHTGYDVNITDENGVRYSAAYTVSIDAVSYDDVTGLITVEFSASDPAIVPELYISFYGYDSKNFIAAGHERDGNDFCQGFRPGCQMEYTPESSGGSASPIFTEDAASVPGAWIVTADPSQWQLSNTPLVPEMIASGVIRRAEIMLAPELNLADLATPGPDLDVVLTGVSQTLNLVTGAMEDDYFKGDNEIVSTAKCNACHDVLASSFHSESGRGGDGIVICKNCHNVTYAGSHLEMTSRSIDNYVHAIHSFQDFDVGVTFETFDAVEAKRYDMHTKHVFPNFTIRNCEACHVNPDDGNGSVVYNVPDQSQSMPSLLSSSNTVATWYDIVDDPNDPLDGLAVENPTGRNIGSIPSYITGAASRACGGCHRARLIRDDAAGALGSFNAHTEAGGTLVDATEDTQEKLYGIIDKIMGFFE